MNNAETIQAEAVTITDASALAGSSTSTHYISEWRPDASPINHTVVFEHNLGRIPTSLLMIFSPDLQTAFPLQWSWEAAYSGNPVTISMDSRTLTLQIFGGVALHGAWSANTGNWTMYKSGYWRVIASV